MLPRSILLTAGVCLLAAVASTHLARCDSSMPEAEAAVGRYVALLKDGNPLVRKRAALALRRLGAKGKTAVPALEQALSDTDSNVRAAVAAALEAIDPMTPGVNDGQDRRRAGDSARLRPSMERLPAGKLLPSPGRLGLLLRRRPGEEAWQRVPPQAEVHTTDRLMSPPGSGSEIRLASGIDLHLLGNLYDFSREGWRDYLQESVAVLHANPSFDLDVTLQRGQFFLRQYKDRGPAQVRLRFDQQTWDLTLQEPGTEVAIDFLKNYTSEDRYRDGEEPRAELYLVVFKGKASLQTGPQAFEGLTAPPGPALYRWNNKGRYEAKPQQLSRIPDIFYPVDFDTDQVRGMRAALASFVVRLAEGHPLSKVLKEELRSDRRFHRLLALYWLGAVDEVRQLIDAVGDADPARQSEREVAIFTLRRWMSRDALHDRLLYDHETREGLLMAGHGYRPAEAESFHTLLHLFRAESRAKPELYRVLTNYLGSDRIALAELAHWHLKRLAGDVPLPDFNAAWPRPRRDEVVDAIKKLIADGRLPPPAKPEVSDRETIHQDGWNP